MSGTLSPWPVVQIGHHGHPVETLQFLLRARGHQLTVDGAFGPLTAAAAKAFQTSKGLTSDGVINPQTWMALVIQVKRGDRGDAVRGVQQEFQFRNGSGDPNQGLQIDGSLRTTDRCHRARLSARAVAGHSRGGRGRHRRPHHLAGAGQRDAVGIASRNVDRCSHRWIIANDAARRDGFQRTDCFSLSRVRSVDSSFAHSKVAPAMPSTSQTGCCRK